MSAWRVSVGPGQAGLLAFLPMMASAAVANPGPDAPRRAGSGEVRVAASAPTPGGESDLRGPKDKVARDGSISAERVEWHVPDSVAYRERAHRELEQKRRELALAREELKTTRQQLDQARRAREQASEGDDRARIAELESRVDRVNARIYALTTQTRDLTLRVNYLTRVLAMLGMTARSQRSEPFRLTLEEALRSALANNYGIQVEGYNPAVETTRLVEAQAAFDALFFANITKNKIDRPSGSQLTSTDLDLFDSRFGIRKLLPSGTSVGASYGLRRTKTSLSFQQINPEYFSDFRLEMRQPLLRGFGLDYNRFFIVVTRNDWRISQHAFRRRVRDTVRQVEEAYWRLAQARRNVVVTARLIGEFEQILETLLARKDFDVIDVQIYSTDASLERSRAILIQERAAVFDAEDQLIALMNREDVDLADDTELIPTDFPPLDRVVVDRLADVQSALDHRPEIREQQLRVANAKLGVGRAKIDELPRLDLTFRYTVDGLAGTADKSFDELTRQNFIEYLIGVELEVPIGNRGARAAHERARLQHAQQVAALKQVFEEVILDVNVAVRQLDTYYNQIKPLYDSTEAKEDEVETNKARQVGRDYNTLINELNAHQGLRTTRQDLLRRMIDYRIAIADLERAKGTLLRYYNIVIADADE